MKNILIIAAIILLSGCKTPDTSDIEIPNVICSDEQFKSVEREVRLCEKTGYLSSYCLRSAMSRYCTKIKKGVE